MHFRTEVPEQILQNLQSKRDGIYIVFSTGNWQASATRWMLVLWKTVKTYLFSVKDLLAWISLFRIFKVCFCMLRTSVNHRPMRRNVSNLFIPFTTSTNTCCNFLSSLPNLTRLSYGNKDISPSGDSELFPSSE